MNGVDVNFELQDVDDDGGVDQLEWLLNHSYSYHFHVM